ncbi:MAG: hypothetical protein O7H41_08415 [Planctomycetota bacterium]|nr:hypothetical protein [Planctomycetota bacterium]
MASRLPVPPWAVRLTAEALYVLQDHLQPQSRVPASRPPLRYRNASKAGLHEQPLYLGLWDAETARSFAD